MMEHLYLRPHAAFEGVQLTDKGEHAVRVELQAVDLAAGTLGGSFEITKLNERIPRMRTYFEGEIVGNRFGFRTEHAEWGATRESDLQHWQRLGAGEHEGDASCIYMRWKERFLLEPPADAIEGASFSGFYYVCLEASGRITGYYYQQGQPAHERYQSLDLESVWDKGVSLGA